LQNRACRFGLKFSFRKINPATGVRNDALPLGQERHQVTLVPRSFKQCPSNLCDKILFWLRQCALGLIPPRLLNSRSQTSPLKGQRPRPRIHRRGNQDSIDKRSLKAPHLGKSSRLSIIVSCKFSETQGQQYSMGRSTALDSLEILTHEHHIFRKIGRERQYGGLFSGSVR